jgi:quercetin dioxygenase-like cupin family protein
LLNLPKETLRIVRWASAEPPSHTAIKRLLEAEGLSFYAWWNDPLEIHEAHSHPFNKVIYVAEGSITFSIPKQGLSFTLKAGDRLDLPAGTIHDAVVSVEGVTCFETQWLNNQVPKA